MIGMGEGYGDKYGRRRGGWECQLIGKLARDIGIFVPVQNFSVGEAFVLKPADVNFRKATKKAI
jgi:hypothetical protein